MHKTIQKIKTKIKIEHHQRQTKAAKVKCVIIA